VPVAAHIANQAAGQREAPAGNLAPARHYYPRSTTTRSKGGHLQMAIIEAAGLTKRYGQVTAVDGLSFTVEAGQVVGFLGPNGAGKTTALRMLLGLVRPDSGSATICGRIYADLTAPAAQVGSVFEASSFHPGRTARNHLRVQALACGVDAARIDDVLELVDLGHAASKRVGAFSLGMRQRLGLATALLADPDVLILDEPANGLDPEGVHWLRDLLRGMAADGTAVLVSSHILAEVAQTADSVIIVSHGRLVTQAPVAELTAGTGLEDVFLRLTAAENDGDKVRGDDRQGNN